MGLQLLGAMARLHVSVLEELVGRFWLRHRLDFTLHGQISFGQAGAGHPVCEAGPSSLTYRLQCDASLF